MNNYAPRTMLTLITVLSGVLTGVLLPRPAAAATADIAPVSLTESDFLGEVPIVLSVTRLAQPVTEAPAATTIIDRQTIDASGAREISDLFRLVPGFTVGYLDGHTASVSYHGLADEFSRRMQVLVDGRSVYMPSFGNVDWTGLPIALDDVQRIEVTRGPNSASYGANSFLGVINIITRHAAEAQGGNVSLAAGSHKVRDGLLRYGGATGGLTYRITAGHRQDDGFDAIEDDKRVGLFNARAEYQLDADDALDAQFGYSGGARGAGTPDDSGSLETEPVRYKFVNNHFQQLRWTHSGPDSSEFHVQFYHTYHDTNDDYTTPPLPTPVPPYSVRVPVTGDIHSERYDLEFQHGLNLHPSLRAVWGASARLDEVVAPYFFGTSDTLNSELYRLFGNLEWRVSPDLLANLGAMAEHNDLTGTAVTPRAALNYHLGQRDTLRASLSTATRTPVLFEELANTVLDTGIYDPILMYSSEGGLRSERILSREIGWLHTWPERGLNLDVKIYDDNIYDLIQDKRISSCITYSSFCIEPYKYSIYRNLYDATARGVDLQLDYQIDPDTRLRFGGAYTHIISRQDKKNIERSAPQHSAYALLMRALPGNIDASLAYYQVGAQEFLGSGNPMALHRRLDLRLAHRLHTAGGTWHTALVAQNVLGDYKEFVRLNVFDSRVFMELAWEFQ